MSAYNVGRCSPEQHRHTVILLTYYLSLTPLDLRGPVTLTFDVSTFKSLCIARHVINLCTNLNDAQRGPQSSYKRIDVEMRQQLLT